MKKFKSTEEGVWNEVIRDVVNETTEKTYVLATPEDTLKLEEIKFTVGDIIPLIDWGKSRVTNNLISKVLREELVLDYSSVNVRNYNNIRNQNHSGKFFTAKRSQFITEDLMQASYIQTKKG